MVRSCDKRLFVDNLQWFVVPFDKHIFWLNFSAPNTLLKVPFQSVCSCALGCICQLAGHFEEVWVQDQWLMCCTVTLSPVLDLSILRQVLEL